jgi:predicted DsbA family dithiol-disulfide isomerase
MSSDHVVSKVKSDVAEAKRLGINSTPTFFVGRVQPDGAVNLMLKISGAQPADVFAKAVQEVRSAKVAQSRSGQLLRGI